MSPCVISRAKRTALGLALGLTMALPLQAETQQSVSLTIEESRQVAVQALSAGQPQVAVQIALGLLQRDGADAFAHYVLARAMQQMQQPQKGRQAAARAFRHAKTQVQKYEASQLAATLAFEQGAPGLAQVWLRRSWNHAPSDQARAVLKKDYATLRQVNPWQVRGRLSVVPSDNVNGGARDPFMYIEGVPYVGILSGDARALPGTKIIGDFSVGYRLRQDKTSQTRITGRIYANRVRLSDEARRIAPGAQNDDFAYSDISIGLEHQVNPNRKTQTVYSASVGQLWYAGNRFQDRISLGVVHTRPNIPMGRLQLSGHLQRAAPAGRVSNLYQAELGAQFDYPLKNGDLFGIGLTGKMVATRSDLHRERRISSHLTYGFGKPIGPAKLSVTVGASLGYFPDYRLGNLIVPGGRDDQSLFASARFTFEGFDYAGFAPTLTVHAQQNRSNVSRFSSDAISVSLGFVSRF
jgi:hypothetical protein